MAISKKVISFGPPKEAALYFDEVLPFDMATGLLATLPHIGSIYQSDKSNSIPIADGRFDENVISNLMGPDGIRLYKDHITSIFALVLVVQLNRYNKNSDKDVPTRQLIDNFSSLFDESGIPRDKIVEATLSDAFKVEDFIDHNITAFASFIEKAGYSAADEWYPKFNARRPIPHSANRQNLFGVCIRDLDLIDIDSLSWDAVLEFRKDKKSRNALRDFRIFFSKNFEGIDQSEISDRLHSALNDYEVTRRAWGFEAVKNSLSVAVSQQGMATSSIGTLSAALMGAPTAMAALVGASVSLGGCVLEFAQIAVDRWKSESVRPTRFLTELKNIPNVPR